MNEWLQKQMETGFRDLKGLSITGHIPIKDRLINELISEALRGAAAPAPVVGKESAPLDLRGLLQFVKKAEVHATDGELVLDVEVRV